MAKLTVKLCTKYRDVDFEPFFETFKSKTFKEQLNLLMGFQSHRQVIVKSENGVRPHRIDENDRLFLKKLLIEYMCITYQSKQ